jgi:hypothetical protein
MKSKQTVSEKNEGDLYETHKLLVEAGFEGLAELWDLESAKVTAEKVVKENGVRREVVAVVEMKRDMRPERIYSVLRSGKGKMGYEKNPDLTEFVSEAIWKGMEKRVIELLLPAEGLSMDQLEID